jgi:hypothetical protein
MKLDPTDEVAAVLRYPLSPSIRRLHDIRAKLPKAPPSPPLARPPPPEERDRERAPRQEKGAPQVKSKPVPPITLAAAAAPEVL